MSLKETLSNVGTKIVLILSLVIGVLAYFLQLKNRKINSLKASIDLLDTEKAADILEAEINTILEDKTLLKKEIDEYNKSIVDLNNKREEIKKSHVNKTPQEIEDYWNKN